MDIFIQYYTLIKPLNNNTKKNNNMKIQENQNIGE